MRRLRTSCALGRDRRRRSAPSRFSRARHGRPAGFGRRNFGRRQRGLAADHPSCRRLRSDRRVNVAQLQGFSNQVGAVASNPLPCGLNRGPLCDPIQGRVDPGRFDRNRHRQCQRTEACAGSRDAVNCAQGSSANQAVATTHRPRALDLARYPPFPPASSRSTDGRPHCQRWSNANTSFDPGLYSQNFDMGAGGTGAPPPVPSASRTPRSRTVPGRRAACHPGRRAPGPV